MATKDELEALAAKLRAGTIAQEAYDEALDAILGTAMPPRDQETEETWQRRARATKN